MSANEFVHARSQNRLDLPPQAGEERLRTGLVQVQSRAGVAGRRLAGQGASLGNVQYS